MGKSQTKELNKSSFIIDSKEIAFHLPQGVFKGFNVTIHVINLTRFWGCRKYSTNTNYIWCQISCACETYQKQASFMFIHLTIHCSALAVCLHDWLFWHKEEWNTDSTCLGCGPSSRAWDEDLWKWFIKQSL